MFYQIFFIICFVNKLRFVLRFYFCPRTVFFKALKKLADFLLTIILVFINLQKILSWIVQKPFNYRRMWWRNWFICYRSVFCVYLPCNLFVHPINLFVKFQKRWRLKRSILLEKNFLFQTKVFLIQSYINNILDKSVN